MIGASKILTVSYGTFSCTLEGFDEPFNTMKAIAEYFRDLAADDRYFGAEPPTPDAAMLHKIAEREIQRRVEAKISENGVTLRAGSDLAPDARAPQLLPQATRAELAGSTAPAAMPPAAQPAAFAPAAAPLVDRSATDSPAIAESVAAKLMRIRNAVAQAAPVATAAPAPQVDFTEDEHAETDAPKTDASDALAIFAPDLLAEPEITADHEGPEIEDADLAAEPGVLAAEPSAPEATIFAADAGIEEAEIASHPEAIATEIAANEGLSALISETVGTAANEDLAERAKLDLAQTDLLPEEDVAQLEVLIADDEDDALPEDFGIDDFDAAALAAALADEEAPAIATAAATVDDGADESVAEDEDDDLLLASIGLAAAQDTDAEQAVEPIAELVADLNDAGATFADSDAAFEEDLEDGIVAEPSPETSAETSPETSTAPSTLKAEISVPELTPALEKLQRARARVIKIRRPEPAAPEALTPEAEEALQRDLAEAHDETPADAAARVQPTRPVAPNRPAASDHRQRMDDKTGEVAVNRLIAQTNTEMEVPEQRRRLSAIAHLKAAVAATVADRLAGARPGPTEDDRIDPYRNDLSRMVRPAGNPATPGNRPAPLVLVSEQRIDRRPADLPTNAASDAPHAAVRPRRVSASNLAVQVDPQDADEDEDEVSDDVGNLFTDTKGFADFADRLGAHALPDLLEAAAAYTACVEGRPHFSRPQLISQIIAVSPEGTFNRENSLRGFGTLLRTGKIAKIKRGQFVLTEASHYLSEARKFKG
ncbi:MAG: hypothetical protein U1D35_11785 [Paracoccaceae bacterium]|nr:hypothetical protein [Paracoccaceae bacterium]